VRISFFREQTAKFFGSREKIRITRSGISDRWAEIRAIRPCAALRRVACALPSSGRAKCTKEATVPSPLFNFLFVAALFVPALMYIGGVIILMLSLVVKHYRLTHAPAQHIEAVAH
jgi:hypothetical protein